MTELSRIKATQKRSQYARYGKIEVLDFKDWLPGRIADLKAQGAEVLKRNNNGIMEFKITWEGGQPGIFTENDFRDQYEEEYLSRFGLKCSLPFEENAGIGIITPKKGNGGFM